RSQWKNAADQIRRHEPNRTQTEETQVAALVNDFSQLPFARAPKTRDPVPLSGGPDGAAVNAAREELAVVVAKLLVGLRKALDFPAKLGALHGKGRIGRREASRPGETRLSPQYVANRGVQLFFWNRLKQT